MATRRVPQEEAPIAVGGKKDYVIIDPGRRVTTGDEVDVHPSIISDHSGEHTVGRISNKRIKIGGPNNPEPGRGIIYHYDIVGEIPPKTKVNG
jgi:hypothetical protein